MGPLERSDGPTVDHQLERHYQGQDQMLAIRSALIDRFDSPRAHGYVTRHGPAPEHGRPLVPAGDW